MTTQEYLAARKSKNWKFNQVVNENAFKNVNSRRIKIVKKTFISKYESVPVLQTEVELFTWEKLDYVDLLKKEFSLY